MVCFWKRVAAVRPEHCIPTVLAQPQTNMYDIEKATLFGWLCRHWLFLRRNWLSAQDNAHGQGFPLQLIADIPSIFSGSKNNAVDPSAFFPKHPVFNRQTGLAGIAAHDHGLVRNRVDIHVNFPMRATFLAAVQSIFQKIGKNGDKIDVCNGRILLRIRRRRNRNAVFLRFDGKAAEDGIDRGMWTKHLRLCRVQALVILLHIAQGFSAFALLQQRHDILIVMPEIVADGSEGHFPPLWRVQAALAGIRYFCR